MGRLHALILDNASGTLVGEQFEERDNLTTAEIHAALQARQLAGITVLDANDPATVRPPKPAAPVDPLKAAYGKAHTVADQLDVIAQRLGLK